MRKKRQTLNVHLLIFKKCSLQKLEWHLKWTFIHNNNIHESPHIFRAIAISNHLRSWLEQLHHSACYPTAIFTTGLPCESTEIHWQETKRNATLMKQCKCKCKCKCQQQQQQPKTIVRISVPICLLLPSGKSSHLLKKSTHIWLCLHRCSGFFEQLQGTLVFSSSPSVPAVTRGGGGENVTVTREVLPKVQVCYQIYVK